MTINDYISLYRTNGYITELRKHIGHAPVMCTSGGVIIENDRGEILLQRRRDNNRWGIIGGAMEIGESILETVVREAREESGLIVANLELFGIYTGMDRFITYPNGDICYVTSIVFRTKSYTGEIINQATEATEHRFFSRGCIPDEINSFDRAYIDDWLKNSGQITVK